MVGLTLFEMNEREMSAALEERRLDVALVPRHTLWPTAVAVPVSRERLVAAIPAYHKLAAQQSVTWVDLVSETLLVQGWDDSHSAREFFASFLGSGVNFRTHAASKQSVLALIAAGYGVTLATESQAEAKFPGVEYRDIAETNAWVDVELAWIANSEEAVVGRFIAFMRDQAATGFGGGR
jgi:DNA-binding transcriptional LysR family regulator